MTFSKKTVSLILMCLITHIGLLKAQNIQLFTEDFQTGGTSFTLNGAGIGSNSGNNQWVINNLYSGVPTYPNTMSEDSTYSGTISSAPYSYYMHIYDAVSGINNCNYDPTNLSDHFTFMSNGMCTLGMDSIHFSFFYLCEGSSTAYGQVYYSANGGPWIQTGQNLYNNKSKWQYEDIVDPAFSNVANLRFGFRWQNDNSAATATEAFGIDDINIVATYNSTSPVTITVDSVSPATVCQGTYLSVYYHLSDTLCNATYQIELSNASGTFPSSFSSWVTTMSYPQTQGFAYIQLPNGATPGTCYKIRVSRTSPAPAITGIASACFTIDDCPNVINTLQPVITMDTNAICIGSAIDVPFTSTGVYLFNTYTAELSDSTGAFTSPTVVGTFSNSDSYDPLLGANPGSVSGLVPTVPSGCNYYIRVVSDGPVATGSAYGPFCIRRCDVTTNNTTDLSFCIQDCSVNPTGLNSLISVNANNDTAIYSSGNVFNTQLLSSMDFSQIGTDGILGSVAATGDTTLNVHITCKDSLPIVGIPTGMNYMRVIGTNGNQPDNQLGSLIRVTIGAIRSTPQIVTSYDYGAPYDFTLPYPWIPAKDTFCSGETVMLMFDPYSYSDNSTYKWICSGINGGNPFVSPSGANSNTLYVNLGAPGTLTFKIQETNYGCTGAWSQEHSVVVLGPPSVSVAGPSIVCQDDTSTFSVPFSAGTYYSWSSNNGIIVDTANNEIDITFSSSTGAHNITINAINQCGSATATKNVTVKPHPTAHAGNDTTVCVNQPIALSTPTNSNYSYLWTEGSNTISTASTATINPTATATYILQVTGVGGCIKQDSINVTVAIPDSTHYADSICPSGAASLQLYSDTTGNYLWSTGATTSNIAVHDTGIYILAIGATNTVCPKILSFTISADVCPVDLSLPNVFSPNGDGNNDYFTPISPGEFGVYRFDKFSIKIFNRWGLLVYEATDVSFKWNGANKSGKAESDGVYYYVIETSTNQTANKPLNGFVTLTR